MGKCIVKFGEKYCMWSTIVDAPVTDIIILSELIAYQKEEYGRAGLADFQQRIERADACGTSSRISTKEDLLRCNHAGASPENAHISEEEIIKLYTPDTKFACPVCGDPITATRSYDGNMCYEMDVRSGTLAKEDYTECFTTIGCKADEDHEITDELKHHVLDQINK